MKTTQKNVKNSKSNLPSTARRKPRTLVVNLLAGPGAGKSTMAAAIFAELKWRGVDCELAAEYAKDLVWEKRHKTFENQVYIFGKQHHRIFRLLGQVQVVITDSPILLTPIYDAELRYSLKQLALEEAEKCWNLNLLIQRKKKYNPNGRLHSHSEARGIDAKIEGFLLENHIDYALVEGSPDGVIQVCDAIEQMLHEGERKTTDDVG